jgi:16S rRNA (guanine527-N7)-methyltransferase
MTSAAPSRHLVEAALPTLGLALTNTQIDALLTYLDLISKWTRVYNLTALRDPVEMVTHHLLDCLAAMAPLAAHYGHVRHLKLAGPALHSEPKPEPGLEARDGQGTRLLDVGSGAGLPGVVIAICFPGISVTCVDTVAKKAAFITQVALTLKLPNLTGLHARVEALAAPAYPPFDVICSRAFASLADFTQWSAGALAPAGVWMAMKGKLPQDEIAALPGTVEVFHVEQLKVPELDAERCIVWMRKRPGQP